jgi:hypothetical protein
MGKAIFVGKHFLGAAFLVLCYCGLMSAQITQVRPIDIAEGLRAGTVHMTIVPAYSGDTLKPFDGNRLNALEMVGSDTLILTLQFHSLLSFQKSKVFFWNSSQWTVEVAKSLQDLDSRNGTYIRLVDGRTAPGFAWDSVSFSTQNVHYVRLRVKNPSGPGIRLGEWTLEGIVTFTQLLILPRPTRLLPGTSLQLSVKILDDRGRIYPNFLNAPILWRSANTSIAIVDETGRLTGVAPGSTTVTAEAVGQPMSGANSVSVESEFRSQKVEPMHLKVALVVLNPRIPAENYKRIHEIFRWRDPMVLTHRLVELFKEASDGVVNYQIVDTIDDIRLFTYINDTLLTATRYYNLLKEPGWTTLRNTIQRFDYVQMVTSYGFDRARNNGVIDEVWVFGGPGMGMYESQLIGPNAFWWNSPPIRTGTALTKLLSVMGLNYERGVDMAFHSFGHRFESAMTYAYYQAHGVNWNPLRPNPTPWDLFTRIDKHMPGQAHIGNIHFPPNGTRDYDYGNTRLVTSHAQNWYRYPHLFDQTAQVNVDTWVYRSDQYPRGDPLAETQDHLGYLRWWYDHIPRYVGVTEGVLNNWWHYFIDYEAAVALAKRTPLVGVDEQSFGGFPREFDLKQNFPNPFNPATTIEFSLAQRSFVTIKVFDVLGREVQTVVHEELEAGPHAVVWDASGMPSGVYFYRLYTRNHTAVKKMVLTK